MATKTPAHNANAPDFRSMFNWGLKLTDFSEIFLLAGAGSVTPDMVTQHEGDPVGQTQYILEDVDKFIAENGYGRNDIIRIEFTMTKDVTPESYEAIFGLFSEYFADVDVKPAAGTLRVIEALALPGMLVEYEFWLAK